MVKTKEPSFYVYLGPTIRGIVQKGAIYNGTRPQVEAILADAIKQYPRIARLIISEIDLAEARVKIRTKGNAIYEENRKFIQELNKGE